MVSWGGEKEGMSSVACLRRAVYLGYSRVPQSMSTHTHCAWKSRQLINSVRAKDGRLTVDAF